MLGIVLPASYLLLEALLEVRSGGNGSHHRHVRTKKRAKKRTAVEEDEGDGGSMAHIKDDFDASIAQDTVFDWGFSRDSLRSGDGSSAPAAGGGGGGEASGSKAAAPQRAPSSRYDPKAMSRIVDITDLVDDSDDEDSDSGDFESVGVPRSGTSSRSTRGGRGGDGWGSRRGGAGRASRGRLMLALTAVAAVVVSGAIAITYVILYPQDFKAALRPSKMGEGSQGARQQLMLELAERVTLACDVSGGGATSTSAGTCARNGSAASSTRTTTTGRRARTTRIWTAGRTEGAGRSWRGRRTTGRRRRRSG